MTLNIKLVVPNKQKCSGFDLKDIPNPIRAQASSLLSFERVAARWHITYVQMYAALDMPLDPYSLGHQEP